jgi:hypothetical protein
LKLPKKEEKTIMTDPRTTIYPTFDCFTDAMEFIAAMVGLPEIHDFITLVHGICVTEEQKEYAHAWIEDSNAKIVIFCGIWMGAKTYFAAPFEEYFKTYQVKESTRYTIAEAMKMNLKTVSYGPWEEKYDALCGSSEQTILGSGHMENVSLIGNPTPTPKQLKKGK